MGGGGVGVGAPSSILLDSFVCAQRGAGLIERAIKFVSEA
jgi:hypothetical protein